MDVPRPTRPTPARERRIPGPSGAERRRFQRALLSWYRPRARPLRLRATHDPWAILVAEVMSQQTQIARVDEAWVSFMARFPTPRALAEASPAEVVRAWAGLGYNKRALALQRAAGVIEAEHSGRVPAEIAALEALPGVGPYTARAVASVAYGVAVAAVDTNVRRVLSRISALPLGAAALQSMADQLVPHAEPGTWTHASIELGATVCRVRSPLCDECPISVWCASAGRVGQQVRRPAAMPPLRFEATTRWLRGRIVARLRDVRDGGWTTLPDTIGEHGAGAVDAMLDALERDGLLERRSDGAVRLPSTST